LLLSLQNEGVPGGKTMELKHVNVTVRMPKELHGWLKEYAEECGRSINNQVIQILKEKKREEECGKSDQRRSK
jgi:predicted HicB family RNase H-like nuclease